ncbi:MAG: murein transglycosylase A [Thermodesulfobacteriota bacterium]
MIKKISLNNIWICFFVALVCFFTGCFPGVREDITKFNSLKKLKLRDYPLFDDKLDLQGLTTSIDNSIAYFKRVPLQRKYQYGKEIYNAAHMIASLETFKEFLQEKQSVKALNKFIKSKFIVFAAAGNEDEQTLFTGYFEPTYEGGLKKSDVYKYPVYSIPNDLMEIDLSLFSGKYDGHKRLVARVDGKKNRIVPYYSRAQINFMEDFKVKSEPLVWLKSRVDRFFLEIQGSGRVVLDSKEELRLHYARSNGNAYQSIGRYLIRKNEILKEDMSMQAIRKWLELNPDRMDEVLHHNGSFVFFQTEDGGPYGSLGVEVTPFRSIATDRRLFPKGALCFMQSRLPDPQDVNSSKEWEKASFFVLNQDTGGAINGPARADLFCGNSDYATFTAGHMNQYGKLFFLVLK